MGTPEPSNAKPRHRSWSSVARQKLRKRYVEVYLSNLQGMKHRIGHSGLRACSGGWGSPVWPSARTQVASMQGFALQVHLERGLVMTCKTCIKPTS